MLLYRQALSLCSSIQPQAQAVTKTWRVASTFAVKVSMVRKLEWRQVGMTKQQTLEGCSRGSVSFSTTSNSRSTRLDRSLLFHFVHLHVQVASLVLCPAYRILHLAPLLLLRLLHPTIPPSPSLSPVPPQLLLTDHPLERYHPSSSPQY